MKCVFSFFYDGDDEGGDWDEDDEEALLAFVKSNDARGFWQASFCRKEKKRQMVTKS